MKQEEPLICPPIHHLPRTYRVDQDTQKSWKWRPAGIWHWTGLVARRLGWWLLPNRLLLAHGYVFICLSFSGLSVPDPRRIAITIRFSAAFSLYLLLSRRFRFFFWVVSLSPVHFPNQGHSGIGLSAWDDAEEEGRACSDRVV